MSWYYVGAGGAAANTFFTTDPTTYPTRKVLTLRRYTNLNIAAFDTVTLNVWSATGLNATGNEPVVPRMFNLGETWMLLPGSYGGYWKQDSSATAPYDGNGHAIFQNWSPWFSKDNGLTWTQCGLLPVPTNVQEYLSNMRLGGYLDASGNPVWVVWGYSGYQTTGTPHENRIKAWYSTNNGQSWTITPSYGVNGSTTLRYVPVGFGVHGMLTSNGSGIIFTSDFGQTSSPATILGPQQDSLGNTGRYDLSFDNFTSSNTTFAKGYSSMVNGDIDRQAMTYNYSSEHVTPQNEPTIYKEVINLGNNIWFRHYGLNGGYKLGLADPVFNGNRFGQLSTDGGVTWTTETTNRFTSCVFTGTNAIRTTYDQDSPEVAHEYILLRGIQNGGNI